MSGCNKSMQPTLQFTTMKLDFTNDFTLPLTEAASAAFDSKLHEVIAGQGCLLLEWTNGDNLMLTQGDQDHLIFAFYNGHLQRWWVNLADVGALASGLVSDKNQGCESALAQCAACSTAFNDLPTDFDRLGSNLKCA